MLRGVRFNDGFSITSLDEELGRVAHDIRKRRRGI